MKGQGRSRREVKNREGVEPGQGVERQLGRRLWKYSLTMKGGEREARRVKDNRREARAVGNALWARTTKNPD